jgi:hypothetical protein
MRQGRLWVPAVLIAWAVLIVSPTKANIVSDGGFENATLTGCFNAISAPNGLGDGWFASAGEIEVDATGETCAGTAPPEVANSGNRMAYLDWAFAPNSVAQTLATVPGQSYTISYFVADSAPNSLEVSFGNQVLFDGTAHTAGVGSPADYLQQIFTATATSSSTLLVFTDQYSTGNGTLLDDVSVTPATPIPEPHTLSLLLFGLVFCLFWRRKFSAT